MSLPISRLLPNSRNDGIVMAVGRVREGSGSVVAQYGFVRQEVGGL